MTSTGGTTTPQPGFGPNTRTIMQIKIAAKTPAPAYDLASLQAAFATTSSADGVFKRSQNPIIIPDARYNSAYNGAFAPDTSVRIFQTDATFTTLDGTLVSGHNNKGQGGNGHPNPPVNRRRGYMQKSDRSGVCSHHHQKAPQVSGCMVPACNTPECNEYGQKHNGFRQPFEHRPGQYHADHTGRSGEQNLQAILINFAVLNLNSARIHHRTCQFPGKPNDHPQPS
jgi:hypothetical protein